MNIIKTIKITNFYKIPIIKKIHLFIKVKDNYNKTKMKIKMSKTNLLENP